MPHGQHKGKPLGVIPTSYLVYVLKNYAWSSWLLSDIREEVKRRKRNRGTTGNKRNSMMAILDLQLFYVILALFNCCITNVGEARYDLCGLLIEHVHSISRCTLLIILLLQKLFIGSLFF